MHGKHYLLRHAFIKVDSNYSRNNITDPYSRIFLLTNCDMKTRLYTARGTNNYTCKHSLMQLYSEDLGTPRMLSFNEADTRFNRLPARCSFLKTYRWTPSFPEPCPIWRPSHLFYSYPRTAFLKINISQSISFALPLWTLRQPTPDSTASDLPPKTK